MFRQHLVPTVALCLILAACGSETSSATGSIGPSASPSTTPRPDTYTTDVFKAPFMASLELTQTSWLQHVDRPLWVYFGWRTAADQDLEGITFIYLDNVAVPPACFGSNKIASWKPDGDGPSAFIAWLRKAGPISVGEAMPVHVGDRMGLQVDVTAERVDRCDGRLFVTQTEPDNGFVFVRGHKSRVIALDVNGATVLIVIDDASPDGFADLVAQADRFLATVTFR